MWIIKDRGGAVKQIVTITGQELWNDKKFLEKRIVEQWNYLSLKLVNWKEGDEEDEYIKSARLILTRFQNRLIQLRGDGEREFDGIFEKNKK